MQENEIIGEQTGSLRPLMKTIIAIAITLSLIPGTALAATKYLEDNVDDFVDKTKSTYGDMIDIAALLHDYDPKLITAVIVVESEGNEVAVSHKGAKGLMQLMPQTAKAMGAKDPKDPFQNILAGTKYLKELENSYGFDSHEAALVAYNMGPSRAKRWLSQYDAGDYGYVQKVMYVYGVLAEREHDEKTAAKSTDQKVAMLEVEQSPRPLMTKPRNFSLASLQFSLPTNRRPDTVTYDN